MPLINSSSSKSSTQFGLHPLGSRPKAAPNVNGSTRIAHGFERELGHAAIDLDRLDLSEVQLGDHAAAGSGIDRNPVEIERDRRRPPAGSGPSWVGIDTARQSSGRRATGE